MKKRKGFLKRFKISNKTISENTPPYIVAEMSANHNGKIKNAIKIIKSAKHAGADAIKIQTYNPDSLTIPSKRKEFVIKKGLWKNFTLYDLYKKASTPLEWQKDLFTEAKKIGITIFSTPFDIKGFEILEKLNCPAYKIASFELVDLDLIQNIAKTKKPLILSTGMASKEEINDAVNIIYKNGSKKLILLHCVSGYPTPVNEINLSCIDELKKQYNVLVGLSDHSTNNTVPLIASSLGACLIEKHFTLSRSLYKSPDSSFSLEPRELKELCLQTKNIKKIIGRPSYKLNKSEREMIKIRRSLYIIKNIKKNQRLTKDHIKSIRPAAGLKPKYLKDVLGKRVKKNYISGTPLKWSMLV